MNDNNQTLLIAVTAIVVIFVAGFWSITKGYGNDLCPVKESIKADCRECH